MRIEVKLLLTFKEMAPAGRQPFHLDLAPGMTVAHAIASLSIPPAAPKVVLINGRLATETQVLQHGDQLTVFPPLEGG